MKLLAVFAHPDDESYGPGATLARYAHTGYDVSLVTLTRGTAGSMGPCRDMGPDDIAVMRTGELECAARALGVGDLRIGDFPDGGLASIPDDEGEGFIRNEILRINPDLVMTFHTDGISGHTDHITVGRWCTRVVKDMPGPVRLVYFGISASMAEMVKEHRKLHPMKEKEITHVIDACHWFEYKLKAIRCHKSQLELWERFVSFGLGKDYFGTEEHFSQVIPAWKESEKWDDLF